MNYYLHIELLKKKLLLLKAASCNGDHPSLFLILMSVDPVDTPLRRFSTSFTLPTNMYICIKGANSFKSFYHTFSIHFECLPSRAAVRSDLLYRNIDRGSEKTHELP